MYVMAQIVSLAVAFKTGFQAQLGDGQWLVHLTGAAYINGVYNLQSTAIIEMKSANS